LRGEGGERLLSSGNLSALMDVVYISGNYDDFGYPAPKNVDKIILIKEPERWLELSRKLSTLIEKNYTQTSDNIPVSEIKQQIIWRLILGGDGQIVGYFAYDLESCP
jgi:hypothetical protein